MSGEEAQRPTAERARMIGSAVKALLRARRLRSSDAEDLVAICELYAGMEAERREMFTMFAALIQQSGGEVRIDRRALYVGDPQDLDIARADDPRTGDIVFSVHLRHGRNE